MAKENKKESVKKDSTKKEPAKVEDRTFAVVTHFIGIFSNIFGALLIFLMTKDKEIKKHSRNALNWQISLIAYSAVIFLAAFIYSVIRDGLFNFRFHSPFPEIYSVFTVINIVLCVIAAVKANDKKLWKYPLAIDFISIIDEKEINKAKSEVKKTIKDIRK